MPLFRIKSFLTSKIFFILGLLLLVFLIYQLGKISLVRYDMNKEITGLQKEADDLEKNQQRLMRLQEFLSTDFFAEREARIKLGMQKKGENVALVQSQEENNETSIAEKKETTLRDNGDAPAREGDKKKNSSLWWDYFFGKQ